MKWLYVLFFSVIAFCVIEALIIVGAMYAVEGENVAEARELEEA